MFGYGVGNFAFALLGLVIAVNLQYFYTDYVGLTAGYVAWSLLLAKIFDAATDPVMGYLSDRSNTRFGRRRPYFLGAAVPLAVAFYLLFTPPSAQEHSQAYLLGYMLVCYVATYLFWTIGAVPYYSLGAELTDDYQERVKVISVREACALAGLLVATIAPAYLIHAYGGIRGYSFMAAILGGGMVVFLVISALASTERAEFQGREPMNPYAGWRMTLRNPHFRKLLLAFACSAIAGAVPAVLTIYVSVYIIGTPEWWTAAMPGWIPTWSYYLLIYFSAGALSLPLWTRVAIQMGKRNAWGVAIALAAVTSMGCAFLASGTVLYFSIVLFFGGLSFGNYLSLPPSMVADLIDWDEVRTGGRREGSYFAIWAFVTKLGAAITGFVALQILEHVGYQPGVPQTERVQWWMLWMYSWFPAALYLASGLALLRFGFSRADLEQAQRDVGRVAAPAPTSY